MPTFKTAFLSLMLTFQVLSLVGCNLPTPKQPEDATANTATFAVETPIKGSSLAVKNSNTFTFPEDKIFNFSVCLEDVAHARPIAGHVFEIKEIQKDVTTDKAGCLNWGEDLKYNYLAAPQYIKITRTIIAKGLHHGSRVVHFAINPWADLEKVPDVLDADHNDVPQIASEPTQIADVLKGFGDTGALKVHPLYVADGNLQVTQTGIGTDISGTYSLEARVAPQVQMTKMNGDTYYQALTAGKFKARLKIVHSYIDNDKTVHHLLAETPVLEATLKNGYLTLDSSVKLMMPTRGQLILGLELSPVDGPQALGPFSGVFMLCDFDSFKGNLALKLNSSNAETSGFSVNQFITGIATAPQISTQGASSLPAASAAPPGGSASALDTPIAVTASQTSGNNDVYQRRIAIENFTYNLKSDDYKIDQALNLIETKRFQVTIAPHIVADSDQSTNFSDSPKLRDGKYLLKMAMVHNFDYDSSNTFVTSSESIVKVSDGTVDVELDFVIHDLAETVNRNNILIEIFPVVESKLIPNTLTPQDPHASLDSLIDTSSTLKSPTFISTMFLSLDDANRVLHVADMSEAVRFLSKNFLPSTPTNLISHVVAQAQQTMPKPGALTTPKDFATTNNLTHLNLQQMGEKSLRQTLQLNTVMGSNSANLNQMQKERVPQYELSATEMSAIVHGQGMSMATARKLYMMWMTDYLPAMSANKGGVFPATLLRTLGMDSAMQVAKSTSADDFFKVEKRIFVSELEENDPTYKPRMLRGNSQDLGVGTNFALSAYHTKSQSSTWTVSTKAGISLKALSVFSAGLDGSYSMNWATSNANSTSNTLSLASNISLSVQQNTFALRFNKYEQCAVVRLNPRLFTKQDKEHWYNSTPLDYSSMMNPRLSDAEKGQAATHGLLICDGVVQTTPIDRVEDYSLVFKRLDLSQNQQDMGDARNRNFYLALRSPNDLLSFISAIRGVLSAPANGYIEQNQVSQTNGALINLFDMAGPSSPGVYLDNN